MRPDVYVIVAASPVLYARPPEELAEIAECVIEAGHSIELLRARDAGDWRLLALAG